MTIERHREAINFVQQSPVLPAKEFFLRYTIAAVGFIVLFGLLAFFSSISQAFSASIKWKSSFLPELPELQGSFGNSSNETRFSLLALGMSPDFPYVGSNSQEPTAIVPSDISIVVIGRFDAPDKASYLLADGTGSFNQTCVIQAGGEVTGIAHNSSAVLLSYSPPKSGKTGIGTCNGNEMFFMPWQH